MEPAPGAVVYDEEKRGVKHIDQIDTNAASVDLSDGGEFSPEEQKHIIQRVDRRLIVTCGFMYCVSLLDRTNLGAAVVAG